MKLSTSEKIAILLESQKHRYAEISQMRESSFKLVTWIIGVFILLAGWVIQGSLNLTLLQKALLALAVCFSSGATLWFIRDMLKGFKKQFYELHKIENILSMYEKGVFDQKESLLSSTWKKRPSGGFFFFIQLLLIFTTVFIVLMIFLSGVLF